MFSWKRGVLAGVLGSLLTGAILVPVGWAMMRQQSARAEEAQRKAQDAAQIAHQEAEQARDQARRRLMEQAADVLATLGGPEKSDAEALRVSSDALTPEIPQGAFLLIDKKPTTYAVGDIVAFRVGKNTYLGRVLSIDKEAGRLTIGRNHEAQRTIQFGEVLGRGVLNTR